MVILTIHLTEDGLVPVGIFGMKQMVNIVMDPIIQKKSLNKK